MAYPISPEAAKLELARRAALRAAAELATERVLSAGFAQQCAFIKDPAKLKALFCTRRAAKSFTAGLYLVYEALSNPGSNCLFIGLTRASARNIIWKDILQVINSKYKIGAVFNKSDLSMQLPNGSTIRVLGVDADQDEMNKLLGGKYRLACIDEASMYTIDVRNLVYGVLKPAMADPNKSGERGTICLMGTSSNFTRGLFYDVTTGKEQGWSLHTWSAADNPHVAKQWAEELEEIRTLRPLYMETPQFRQWYLNQWVVDEEKLVYRFNEYRNLYTDLPKLPPDGWTYTLGIDLGYEDDTAFVLCAYHAHDPKLYVVETYNKKHLPLDDKPGKVSVVAKIKEFMRHPVRAPSRIIIDGAAKQAVETMKALYGVHFEYADKRGKADHIEMLNADLIQGKVKLHTSLEGLRDELMGLVWQTDGDRIKMPKREHPACPNHLADAFLYNWRCCYHYQSQAATPTIPKYSREWYDKQAEDIWEREREGLEKAAKGESGDWPSDGGWGSLG